LTLLNPQREHCRNFQSFWFLSPIQHFRFRTLATHSEVPSSAASGPVVLTVQGSRDTLQGMALNPILLDSAMAASSPGRVPIEVRQAPSLM